MLRLRSSTLSIIGGSQLLGGALRSDEPFFMCDCATLQRIPPTPHSDPTSHASETDGILAAAFSPSGSFFALTDDRKRLVLFRVKPAWERLSVRWVWRRCTALTFSACESSILVADKSGDVFSFSVGHVEAAGRLELGHLSMLLDVAVTQDGRHIITCDRDEKIRVSLWEAPHVISAFCLGHTQFVSRLLPLPGPQRVLVSGSGDGTVRLWRYETGEEIQRQDLRDVPNTGDGKENQRLAVSRLSCTPGGDHLAVLCDRVSGIFLFAVSGGSAFSGSQYIALPCVPADLDFEDSASLWVLSGVKENPIQLYTYSDGAWQPAPHHNSTATLRETMRERWEELQGCAESGFSGLYKAVCDNMAAYMMKKEARLQTDKRKMAASPCGANVKVQRT